MRTLLLALALVGCSPPLTFRVVGPATEEQRAALHDRIGDVNAMTDAKHQAREDPRGAYAVSFPPTIATEDGPMKGHHCARTGDVDCPVAPAIRVRADLSGALLRRVMLHELLHAVGLKHTTGPAIMTPGNTEDAATETDLTECRRVKACPEKAP